MAEGMTCYERDEALCEDGMCLRTGCRIRNERLSDHIPDDRGAEMLAPCPFCGGEDLTVYKHQAVGSRVACISCGLERIVAEFEDIFGDIAATERSWLTDKISTCLAAKPVDDGVREALRVISTMAVCEDSETSEQRGLIVDACREVALAALSPPSPGERK